MTDTNQSSAPAQKLGIDELKAIVSFGFQVKKAGSDIFGGGFHADKLGELLLIVPAVGPILSGLDQAIPEAKDIDSSEIAEIGAMLISQGAISEHVEQVIEKSLNVASAAWALYNEIKG